jgi:hypothetical protein
LYTVNRIEAKDTRDYLLNIHYAKRIPPITYAFGLFEDDFFLGVITYGTPSSSPLRNGIAGKENAHRVLELNRLCLRENKKNEASILISKSLNLLPKGTIVVSFADTSQNHLGIVYQATNFLYTGLSAKRTDYKIRGLEHMHTQTIIDKFRDSDDRIGDIKKHYGDRFYVEDRPRKHRYIYITGSKTEKKYLKKQLRYKIEEYPKGENYVETKNNDIL